MDLLIKTRTGRKVVKSALMVTAFLFIFVNLAFGAYFLNRFNPGVKVAGLNIGGLTRAEATHLLNERLERYKKLDIVLDGRHYELEPDRVGVEYDIAATLEMAWSEGRAAFPPILGAVQSRGSNLSLAYSVEPSKLKDFVAGFAASQSQSPVDAEIVVVDGRPRVEPDKSGLGIDSGRLTGLIKGAFQNQISTISLQREVLPAQIKSADLDATLADTRKLVATKIELSYADKSFAPNPKVVGGWLAFAKDNNQPKMVVDRVKMEPYLKTVADSIYIAPKNHLINVQNGTTTGEEAGVEGLEIDKEGLATAIMATLAGASTGKIPIQTHTLPFKTVYNRTISLDFGRYIEINLSSQHMWAYQDHVSIFDSVITSGATGAGFATVTGLFDIKAKQRNRNLNGNAIGYNYNVFVQYWMPFFGNYGLHDASWRSSFGGSDYYYNGSHGCVNMPLETASWVFNWADIGTPVWVHT